MSSYYECKRCFHTTKQKIEMIRHLNRKNKCKRKTESFNYKENDLYNLSLNRINTQNGEKDNILLIKNITSDLNNNIEINNNIKNDDNNSELINEDDDNLDIGCDNCKKLFTRKSSLKRHLINSCKKENNIKHNITINNYNNNYNNNTIIINLNITKPLPFDEDWDISKIDNTLKTNLLLSNSKFTKTLEKILENNNNLNVIIDDNLDNGIVYKNDIEKFIPMKIEDIVDKSMDKIHKHLCDFHKDIDTNNEYLIDDQLLVDEKNSINSKYENYKNNQITQKSVKNYISNIYLKKKEDALKLYKLLLDNENVEGGY